MRTITLAILALGTAGSLVACSARDQSSQAAIKHRSTNLAAKAGAKGALDAKADRTLTDAQRAENAAIAKRSEGLAKDVMGLSIKIEEIQSAVASTSNTTASDKTDKKLDTQKSETQVQVDLTMVNSANKLVGTLVGNNVELRNADESKAQELKGSMSCKGSGERACDLADLVIELGDKEKKQIIASIKNEALTLSIDDGSLVVPDKRSKNYNEILEIFKNSEDKKSSNTSFEKISAEHVIVLNGAGKAFVRIKLSANTEEVLGIKGELVKDQILNKIFMGKEAKSEIADKIETIKLVNLQPIILELSSKDDNQQTLRIKLQPN